MGQKLIITEEEKNNIRLLYEVTPPNESVLVANKNPFKYPEYESARKPYSSTLKDGELFYKPAYSKFNGEIRDMFEPLYRDFLGKTIRLEKEDKILEIASLQMQNYYFIKYNENVEKGIQYGSIIFIYYFNSDNGSSKYEVLYSKNINGEIIQPIKSEWESKVLKQIFPSENVNRSNNPEIYNALYKIGTQIKKKFNEIFTNPSTLPDDIFEIRKVQRQKTDF